MLTILLAGGGILLYEGRIKGLAEVVKNAPIQAVVGAIPRPNQAFWTLSALWAGWLWGREAAEPFKVALRRLRTFARTGAVGDFYFIAQWFPKIGVFEDAGWNVHQFHSATEFFADFGTYDVTLDVPGGWVVGATGRQMSREDAGDRDAEDDQHRREQAVLDAGARELRELGDHWSDSSSADWSAPAWSAAGTAGSGSVAPTCSSVCSTAGLMMAVSGAG